jgi:hypothetical protein
MDTRKYTINVNNNYEILNLILANNQKQFTVSYTHNGGNYVMAIPIAADELVIDAVALAPNGKNFYYNTLYISGKNSTSKNVNVNFTKLI